MKNRIFKGKETEASISTRGERDFISPTDMLKAKDGDFYFRLVMQQE